MDDKMRIDEQSKIAELSGRVIKYDKKSVEDMKQLLEQLNEDIFDKKFNDIITNQDDDTTLNNVALTFFPEKRKIWLELDVEDSYASGLLYSWLFGKSNFDGGQLRILGCSVNTLFYDKPGFTQEQKDIIKQLYKQVVENEM